MNKYEKTKRLIEARDLLLAAVQVLHNVGADESDERFLCVKAKIIAKTISDLIESKLSPEIERATSQVGAEVKRDGDEIQYQEYSYDENWTCMHAGVFNASEMNIDIALADQERWERWRELYLANTPGDFPLRRDSNKRARYMVIHPVGNNENRVMYDLVKRSEVK